MNIYMYTDLEGISGISNIAQISNMNTESSEHLMSDVNAAVAGAFDGGADKVYVWDGHGTGINFIEGKLDKRAIQLPLRNIMPDELISIDGFMLIGTHAMSGTQNAFLDHTQSSVSWHDYYINGKRTGEIGQYAVYAGYFDIPVLMVSGDEAACSEAKKFIGDIATAPVKAAIGRNNARLYDLDESVKRIRQAACDGIGLIGKVKPYKPLMPMEIKIEYNRTDYCDSCVSASDNVERLDARTARKFVSVITRFRDLNL